MLRYIPHTAGLPIGLKDFYKALLLYKNNKDKNLFEKDFESFLGASAAFVVHSGTAALYLILESLKNISNRDTVIIPAYICPLVPLAIARAGFKVKVCDINRDNYDMDLDKLQTLCDDNTLAIVAAHLGGFVCDMDNIKSISEKSGAFIIEDCAQALGADYKDKKVGTIGDFGFFSLCRGKGLTIYEGGVIIARKDRYTDIIKTILKRLVKTQPFLEALRLFELIGYTLFYNPWLDWFIFQPAKIYWNILRMPVNAAGEYFSANFPISNVGRYRKLIGHVGFGRIKDSIDVRIEKARKLKYDLKDIKVLNFIREIEGAKNIPLYFPVIFDNGQERDKILSLLRKAGLGASTPYLYAITDYDYLKDILPAADCPNARFIAAHSIGLSTSRYLREKDIYTIVDIISNNIY